MAEALGMIECRGFTAVVEAADAMLKTADVELVIAQPICAGKYMVMVSGDVGAIEDATDAGKETAGEFLVDSFVIPNVHRSIFPALTATTQIRSIDALGVIETFSVAACIMAADAAVKDADVDIIEIRCATGLGGKSFLYLTGDVASVNSAVQAGIDTLEGSGLVLSYVVIPYPSKEITRCIL